MITARSSRSGFTLIEILIAIALVAIMASVVVPTMFKYLSKGKEDATKAQLRSLQALDAFYADVGQFPETLKDLYTKPANEELANKWEGYLDTKAIPKDGWNFPLQYHNNAEEGAHV